MRKFYLYIPAFLIPAICHILFLFIFSEIIEPEILGRYFIGLSVILFSGSVWSGWFIQSILRYEPGMVKNFDNDLKLLNINYIFITIIFCFILILITYLLASLNIVVSVDLILLIIVCTAVDSIVKVLNAANQARLRYGLFSLSASLIAVMRYFLGYLIYEKTDYKENALFYGMLISELIIILIIIHSISFKYKASLNYQLLGKYMKYGIPISILPLLTEAKPLFERFVISKNFGLSEVAIYTTNNSIGISIVGFISLPLLIVANSLLMKNDDGINVDEKRFISLNYQFMELYIILTTSLFILIPIIVEIAYKFLMPKYMESGSIYIFVGYLSSMIFGIGIYFGKNLELYNKTLRILILNLISYLIFFLFSLILLPFFAINSIVISSIIFSIIYSLYQLSESRKVIDIKVPYRLMLISLIFILLTLISFKFLNSYQIIMCELFMAFIYMFLNYKNLFYLLFNIFNIKGFNEKNSYL